jgi:hypothetical protein
LGAFIFSYDEAAISPKLEAYIKSDKTIGIFGLPHPNLINLPNPISNPEDVKLESMSTSIFTINMIAISHRASEPMPPHQIVCCIPTKTNEATRRGGSDVILPNTINVTEMKWG